MPKSGSKSCFPWLCNDLLVHGAEGQKSHFRAEPLLRALRKNPFPFLVHLLELNISLCSWTLKPEITALFSLFPSSPFLQSPPFLPLSLKLVMTLGHSDNWVIPHLNILNSVCEISLSYIRLHSQVPRIRV